LQIELDGWSLFLVLSGDAHAAAVETAEDLANQASRVLQKAWSEAREEPAVQNNLRAGLPPALELQSDRRAMIRAREHAGG
jgi:hypothetical protein